MDSSWFRTTHKENYRRPLMFKLPNEPIKTFCQVKLFDKNDKPLDCNIWVDDDLKLSLIKLHKWYLLGNLVVDENDKSLLEHITGINHKYVKLKNNLGYYSTCYARNNLVIDESIPIDDCLYIYTRVRTKNNKIAYGIYSENYPDKNMFELTNGLVPYVQLNAVVIALDCFKSIDKNLKIYTNDSNIVNANDSWIELWEKNNWLNSNGEEIKNKDLYQKMSGLIDMNKNTVEIIHNQVKNDGIQDGSGISTLANVITDTDLFKEGQTSVSETQETHIESFLLDNVEYKVIDTVGINNTKLSNEEVIEKNINVINSIQKDVTRVFFTFKRKFTEEELKVLEFLKDIFDNITLVRTKFVNFRNSERCRIDQKALLKEKSKWFSDQQDI
ncbi:7956_t:CDS:2 [Scutellospora calospora]|uniref:7956_t:CDS:1 n=1 Tax=Scutellospora calospora TaxID=85575 RepID=A0ACA9KLA1_9GLOM|nr:7956_t:CDS:2 [Scutellospora calospora]